MTTTQNLEPLRPGTYSCYRTVSHHIPRDSASTGYSTSGPLAFASDEEAIAYANPSEQPPETTYHWCWERWYPTTRVDDIRQLLIRHDDELIACWSRSTIPAGWRPSTEVLGVVRSTFTLGP